MWKKIQEVIDNNREKATPKNFGGLLFENETNDEFICSAAKMMLQLKLSANNRGIDENDIIGAMTNMVFTYGNTCMMSTIDKFADIINKTQRSSCTEDCLLDIYKNLRGYMNRNTYEGLSAVLSLNFNHIITAITQSTECEIESVNGVKYKIWAKRGDGNSLILKLIKGKTIVFEIVANDNWVESGSVACTIANLLVATDYPSTIDEFVLLDIFNGNVKVVSMIAIKKTLHTLISAVEMPNIAGDFLVKTFYDLKRLDSKKDTYRTRTIGENSNTLLSLIKNNQTSGMVEDIEKLKLQVYLSKENGVYNLTMLNTLRVPPLMDVRQCKINIYFDKASISQAIDIINSIVITYGKRLADNSKIVLRNGLISK
ncbi:MAG: hypothetical protein ACRCXX_08685 [Cetobacterium sp.]|uniref:hypothetical protein n=1 Tax=Cetobacterium sp. TaxID=2071632 RepID=UPI003F304D0B